MATTYTTSNRLAKMTTADPAVKGSWGTVQDATMDMVDQSLDGTAVVNIAGLTTYSLTAANNASDQSRPRVLQFFGALSANCTVTIPNVSKVGWVQNLTTGGFSVILTAGSATNATIQNNGLTNLYLCDGATNVTTPTISVPPAGPNANPQFTTLSVTGATALAGTTATALAVSGAATLGNVITADVSTNTLEAAGNALIFGTLGLQGTLTPAGGILGRGNGVNPGGGQIGEYQSAVQSAGLAIPAGPTQFNVTSLQLTPGDWDVWGQIGFKHSSGAFVGIFGWLTTTAGGGATSVGALQGAFAAIQATFATGADQSLQVGMGTLNVTVPTTVYLNGIANLTGSGASATGSIQARRRS